jgi:hypothetical protein
MNPIPVLRRTVLATGGVAVLGLIAGPIRAFGATPDPGAFMAVSKFLTGRADLAGPLGIRFHTALGQLDKGFEAALTTLARAIETAEGASMDAFAETALSKDPALAKTATTIVSAWYLGVVGEKADAVLITYEEALMYQPTEGQTVIPTYGQGPSYWAAEPQIRSL